MPIVASELLPRSHAFDLHALVLVFVAAPYAGFASIDGPLRPMVTESVGIRLFCGLAVLALWGWPPAWILGWYVPFCVVYDLLIAGYLIVFLFA